jgi:hypothetical protein
MGALLLIIQTLLLTIQTLLLTVGELLLTVGPLFLIIRTLFLVIRTLLLIIRTLFLTIRALFLKRGKLSLRYVLLAQTCHSPKGIFVTISQERQRRNCSRTQHECCTHTSSVTEGEDSLRGMTRRGEQSVRFRQWSSFVPQRGICNPPSGKSSIAKYSRTERRNGSPIAFRKLTQ